MKFKEFFDALVDARAMELSRTRPQNRNNHE